MKSLSIDKLYMHRLTPWVNALLFCVGIRGVMALGDATGVRYSNSMLSVILFILLLILGRIVCPLFAMLEKTWRIKAYVFSTLLSASLHIGSEYEFYDGVDFAKSSIYINKICLAIALAPFVAYLWRKPNGLNVMDRKDTGTEGNSQTGTQFNFFYIWAIIFLFWMPVFFALYPGAFVYDATEEYVEVISRQFTMHHPLLHVLALGGIVHLFEYIGAGANAGIAVYVLLQMLTMSAALSYVVRSLQRWGVTKRYAFITVLFFGIFPLFPLYAVCTAKDGLFTVFLLVAIVSMGNIIMSSHISNCVSGNGDTKVSSDKDPAPSMSDMVIFLISSTLMMMLRNNGLYAYASTAIILAVTLIIDRTPKNVPSISSDSSERSSSEPDSAKNSRSQTGIARADYYAGVHYTTSRLLILMALSIVLSLGGTRILKLATGATDGEHQ